MRKLTVALLCVAGALSIPVSSADTRPAQIAFHWIYTKPGATYEQFQSDRDTCAHYAKRPHYAYGVDYSPSSMVFLNCMANRDYTLSKEGWDTGVLWTKPYRRPFGPN